MFNADKPILKEEDDLLGRGKFAKQIAQIIADYSDTDSHVIGLYGEWGSGKTSTINLIHEQLDFIGSSRENAPIFLSFSSWGSNSVSDVFSMFVDSLKKGASKHAGTMQIVNKLIGILVEYGACVTSLYPPIGSMMDKIRALFHKKKEKSIVDLKEQIASILKSSKRKIAVVIDDLDRLSDEQIRHVFQFVNIIADFPNVIYILPFDHEVVTSALSGIQGINGSAYLNKIVQVPLYLPDPPSNSLLTLLDNEVGSLLDAEREDYDRERMYNIVQDFIVPYMKTPRDVRRLQNTFIFQMKLFAEGLNSLDILALSSLITFQPTIYEWVKRNKDLMLGGTAFADPKAHKDLLANSLNEAGIDQYHINDVIQMLSILFPAIQGKRFQDNDSHWRDRRVCHKEIFDGYFAGRISEDWLSSREIADVINSKDFEKLVTFADKCIKDQCFFAFLEEVNCRLDVFSPSECITLGEILFSYWGKSQEEISEFLYYTTADQKIEFMISRLCKKIETPKADSLVANNIPLLDVCGLAAFASFLKNEELAHGRLASDSQNKEKQRLSLEGVTNAEQAFLKKLNVLKEERDFLCHDNLYMLMYLWFSLEEKIYIEFWNSAIAVDSINACYLISVNAGKWTSGKSHGWSFNNEIIDKIIQEDDLRQTIQALINEGVFYSLPSSVLEKTACFYINGYTGMESFDRLSAQDCLRLIPKRKSNE